MVGKSTSSVVLSGSGSSHDIESALSPLVSQSRGTGIHTKCFMSLTRTHFLALKSIGMLEEYRGMSCRYSFWAEMDPCQVERGGNVLESPVVRKLHIQQSRHHLHQDTRARTKNPRILCEFHSEGTPAGSTRREMINNSIRCLLRYNVQSRDKSGNVEIARLC